MKAVYPVIFTAAPECYLIEVPDLDILTQGEAGQDMANAIEMARDAVGLKCIYLEDENETLPKASNPSNVNVEHGTFAEEGRSFVSLVDVDISAYRRMLDNKMIRRNVTLPNWLDCAAEKAKVNVSKILQNALMNELGLHAPSSAKA